MPDPRPTGGRSPAVRTALFLAVAVLAAGTSAGSEDPERADQENSFGVEVAARGLWKEALYRWQKAVDLDPGNARARNNLAVAFERSGQFEEALGSYEHALELQPGNEQIRQNYELFREAYERKKRKDRDAARSRRR